MFDIRKIQEQAIFESVKNKSNDETAKTIVYGENGAARNEGNTTWVNATMHRLENEFDAATTKQIRMGCQCGYGIDEKLALVNEFVTSSSNLKEFASSEKAKAAGLFYQDDSLFLQFKFCPCPMLAEVKKLDTLTWCQCTTGYSKVLFEKAFGCEVDVELLKSIKHGDDICLMKIIPHGSIW